MTALPFKCPDCDATFASNLALGPHRNKAHGYKAAKPKSRGSTTVYDRWKGKYPCPQCNFVAKWKGGLTKHMRALRAPDRQRGEGAAKRRRGA